MSSPAGGDQRRFQPHQLFLSRKLRQVDIPPRKLLSRRAATLDMPVYSPRHDEETLFQKYLPYNNPEDDDDDSELYSADQFRMYEFKVRRCNRSRNHDWTDCPFSHPGEKARRRDPTKYHYSGIVCQDYRRSTECPRGDNCEFAHGIFECWLHPARYRTQACKDGRSCQRKVCFFAHTAKQLRILPQDEGRQCCSRGQYCSVVSPNSTLMSMPDGSPPLSPSLQMGGFTPTRGQMTRAEMTELKKRHGPAYKKELLKLMNHIQSMNMDEKSSASGSGRNRNRLYLDLSKLHNQQPLFSYTVPNSPESTLSPSDPSSSGSGQFSSRNYRNFDFTQEDGTADAPDLGWVDDLCD